MAEHKPLNGFFNLIKLRYCLCQPIALKTLQCTNIDAVSRNKALGDVVKLQAQDKIEQHLVSDTDSLQITGRPIDHRQAAGVSASASSSASCCTRASNSSDMPHRFIRTLLLTSVKSWPRRLL